MRFLYKRGAGLCPGDETFQVPYKPLTWTQRASLSYSTVDRIGKVIGNRAVFVMLNAATQQLNVIHSTDGTTWTVLDAPGLSRSNDPPENFAVPYGGGLAVLRGTTVAPDSYQAHLTTDFLNWSQIGPDISPPLPAGTVNQAALILADTLYATGASSQTATTRFWRYEGGIWVLKTNPTGGIGAWAYAFGNLYALTKTAANTWQLRRYNVGPNTWTQIFAFPAGEMIGMRYHAASNLIYVAGGTLFWSMDSSETVTQTNLDSSFNAGTTQLLESISRNLYIVKGTGPTLYRVAAPPGLGVYGLGTLPVYGGSSANTIFADYALLYLPTTARFYLVSSPAAGTQRIYESSAPQGP